MARPLRKPSIRPPAALLRAAWSRPALDVLRTLDAAGFRSWIVGGTVRDALLGRHRAAADLDVATPARPNEVLELFPRVIPTGIEHGTVTVVARDAAIEVTTFRGEGAYLDARRPSSVEFLRDVDDDLARRDFTVNALAYDPIGREFRDPFGGRGDLRRRLLRAVGDPVARFSEDGLRPLRAARLAAQLGFRVEARTAAAIRPALASLDGVSVERITDELTRLLLAPDAKRGLEVLDRTGLLAKVLPAVAAASPAARRHAYAVVAALPPRAGLAVRLAALVHVVAIGGAVAGERIAGLLGGLRFPGQVRDLAAALVRDLPCTLDASGGERPAAAADVRRWLSRTGPERVGPALALRDAEARAARSRRARAEASAFAARIRRILRTRPPLAPSDLALDGRAVMRVLGVPPGPIVGEALRHLLDRVLEDPRMNTEGALTSELRRSWAPGSPVRGTAGEPPVTRRP